MANARAYGISGPVPVRIEWYPVYASASFQIGDFLILQGTTTGLTIGAAAGNNFANPTSQTTRVFGRAEAPAPYYTADGVSTQPTWVPVTVADIGVWFQIPMYSATPANAVVTLSYLGVDYGCRQVTAGYPAVNIDDTTNKVWRLVSFDSNDSPAAWPAYQNASAYAAGTVQYANAYVTIIGSAGQLTGAR